MSNSFKRSQQFFADRVQQDSLTRKETVAAKSQTSSKKIRPRSNAFRGGSPDVSLSSTSPGDEDPRLALARAQVVAEQSRAITAAAEKKRKEQEEKLKRNVREQIVHRVKQKVVRDGRQKHAQKVLPVFTDVSFIKEHRLQAGHGSGSKRQSLTDVQRQHELDMLKQQVTATAANMIDAGRPLDQVTEQIKQSFGQPGEKLYKKLTRSSSDFKSALRDTSVRFGGGITLTVQNFVNAREQQRKGRGRHS